MNKQIPIIFIFLAVSFLMLGPSLNNAFADIIPPKKQTALGISPEDVTCETGTYKVIRDRTNTPACVKISNVIKFVTSGWAKPIDQKTLESQIKQDASSFGTINKLYTEPVKTQYGKVFTGGATSGYSLGFEVCASFLRIYVPDVLIKSDSETQRYEIPQNVEPNTCILSTTFIKASDPNSITVKLLNKGDVSKLLSDGEAKIASLQQELETAKKALGDKSSPDTSQSSKIIELRKQINNEKEDLYRLYFTIYAEPKEKYNIQKLTFTGAPIVGDSAKIIAVKKSLSAENTFDVVFEACAGEKQINLPVIQVSSDTESTSVKISDKISPNTCQMTSAKITASNPDTVKVDTAGNADSNKIPDIDNQLIQLQKQLNDERNTIRSLIHETKKSDYNEQLEIHSAKIIKLREQISLLKEQYNQILYRAFRQ